MSEQEKARFYLLRRRYLSGESLTTAETDELASYVSQIEEQEAATLRAAQERQEQRIAEKERQIAELRSLIARREALVDYLRRVRQKVTAEQQEIDTAFRRLLSSAEQSPAAVSE